MRVARHEMPGRCQRKRPSQRDGVVGSANGAFDLGHDRAALRNHTVPKGTDPLLRPFQAFHAWLPSSGPCGTEKPPSSNSLLGRIRSTLVTTELRLFHHCRRTWIIRSLISRFASRN